MPLSSGIHIRWTLFTWFISHEEFGSYIKTPYFNIDLTKLRYKEFKGITNLNPLQILFIKLNIFKALQHILSKCT